MKIMANNKYVNDEHPLPVYIMGGGGVDPETLDEYMKIEDYVGEDGIVTFSEQANIVPWSGVQDAPDFITEVQWSDILGKPSVFPTEVSWEDITDKPSVFPTNIDWEDIANKPDVFPTDIDWDSLAGKPSTFAPAPHNHNDLYYGKDEVYTKDEVDALIAALSDE